MRQDTLVLFMTVTIRAYTAAGPLGQPRVLLPLIEGLERSVFHASEGHGGTYKEKVDAVCLDLPKAIQDEIAKNRIWTRPPSHHLGTYIPDALHLKHIEHGLTSLTNVIISLQRFSMTFGPTVTELGAYAQIDMFRTEVLSFIDNAVAFGFDLGRPQVAPRSVTIPSRGKVPSMVAVRAHRARVAAVRGAVDGDGMLSTVELHQQPLSQVTRWADKIFQTKLTELVKTANDIYAIFHERVVEIALLVKTASFHDLLDVLDHPTALYDELVRLNLLREYANYCRRTPLEVGLRHLRTFENNVRHNIPWRREDPGQSPDNVTGVLKKEDMLRMLCDVKNGTQRSFKVSVFSVAPDDPDVGYALGEFYDWFIDGLCNKTLATDHMILCQTILMLFRTAVVPRWKWMEVDGGCLVKAVGDAVKTVTCPIVSS